jgi:hypothetical protein
MARKEASLEAPPAWQTKGRRSAAVRRRETADSLLRANMRACEWEWQQARGRCNLQHTTDTAAAAEQPS